MKELRDIIQAYQAHRGQTLVLATVVAARGSTYRKPGARMLMSEDAWLAGGISGGCLEADLLRKASWRTSRTHAVLVTYDGVSALDDDDASESWRGGFGLGCDGSIDVLIERLAPEFPVHPLSLLSKALHTGRAAVLSTVIGVSGKGARHGLCLGQRVLALAGDEPASDLPTAVRRDITAQALSVLATAGACARGVTSYSRHVLDDTQIEVAHELVMPPRALFVFGQNHDALPLARLAHSLGWDVTLVAHKTPFSAEQVDFTQTGLRILLGRVPEILPALRFTPRSSFVVMTHNYERDKNILRHVLGLPVAYLGVLGPRRRTERMLSELLREGTPIEDAALKRLHAPVGLDLGAVTPEDIALSIVAELQARCSASSARSLRETARLQILPASHAAKAAGAD